MSQKKQKQQNSQPSKANSDAMNIGIDIIETRRRVDELRINIINYSGRDMEAPTLIIQKWLKEDLKNEKKQT